MSDKKVLVTGGAGYIGTHTTVELIESGYEVVVIDNFTNANIGIIKGVEQIVGQEIECVNADCSDMEAMQKVFHKYQFDAVIHFAAFKSIPESLKSPLLYYRNNIDSLLTILELMERCGCNNLVFSSSASVYGQPKELPATESTPVQEPNSPYGSTKQISEQIIKNTSLAKSSINSISLRYFNPIGAHPSAMIGELSNSVPNNLLPYITQTAAGLHPEVKIFGGDYSTEDGTPERDYIDIVDLSKAHVAALKRLLEGENQSPYEVYNVGTGRPVSVMKMIKEFERVNNVKLNYSIVDRRPGDIERIWANTELANKVLGWRAERSLEETLTSAWAWEKRLRGLL